MEGFLFVMESLSSPCLYPFVQPPTDRAFLESTNFHSFFWEAGIVNHFEALYSVYACAKIPGELRPLYKYRSRLWGRGSAHGWSLRYITVRWK